MIYTVGHRPSYEQGFEEYGAYFKKMGANTHSSYPGGSVWETEAEARTYLRLNRPRLDDYEVYGVEASWETDTKQMPGEVFRRLQVDAQLVKLGGG